MSKIQSSDEHLILNADGSNKSVKFQANGVEKASISSAGAFTSTTIDATKLTGNLPAINGSALTNLPADSTKLSLAGGTMTGTLGVTTVDFGDWTITESSGVLYFATGGTNKMKLDASGNLTCVGDVTANGSM